MSYDPLNPPKWHLRFWFYYWRAHRRMANARTENCPHGCCERWVSKRGQDLGGFNPVGVNHFD